MRKRRAVFVCGSGRQPIQRDKTANNNYYLLTLAAIAQELQARGAPREGSVTRRPCAVGGARVKLLAAPIRQVAARRAREIGRFPQRFSSQLTKQLCFIILIVK